MPALREVAERYFFPTMEPKYRERLNQYRSLWVLVFFDLPTETRLERKIATKFRKTLLEDGFAMFQFSIYMRFCASKENAEVHGRRIRSQLPEKGKVGIMQITDKQFGMMDVFIGQKKAANEAPPQQLELF